MLEGCRHTWALPLSPPVFIPQFELLADRLELRL